MLVHENPVVKDTDLVFKELLCQVRPDQIRPGHRQFSHCQGNNYMCPVQLYDCNGVTFDFEILAVWVTFSFEKLSWLLTKISSV